jgi:hypothetical protein
MKKTIIIFLLVGAVYLIVSIYYTRNRGKQNYNRFYNSYQNGIIEDVRGKLKGTGLKLNSDEREFVFYPYTDRINENNIFHYFAEKGDSVYKPAFSDTLQLVKDGKVYKYTFQKF